MRCHPCCGDHGHLRKAEGHQRGHLQAQGRRAQAGYRVPLLVHRIGELQRQLSPRRCRAGQCLVGRGHSRQLGGPADHSELEGQPDVRRLQDEVCGRARQHGHQEVRYRDHVDQHHQRQPLRREPHESPRQRRGGGGGGPAGGDHGAWQGQGTEDQRGGGVGGKEDSGGGGGGGPEDQRRGRVQGHPDEGRSGHGRREDARAVRGGRGAGQDQGKRRGPRDELEALLRQGT
mmetsp:Transcript_2631/g.7242  ORF Transcript_2631/g.7242 Transcript_2631/m.7242 type:complete len:231 (-) Transcript_2631:90-782(-)